MPARNRPVCALSEFLPRIGPSRNRAEERDTFTRLPWLPDEGHREGVQMIEKKYGRRAAEHILGPLMAEDEVLGMLGDALRVDDAGVWTGDEGPWLWLPSMELDTREIDLSATPGLPFPFDALDLAAFMVGGVGGWIREFYGPVEAGPDADRLALMHQHANVARDALGAAYAALRDAADSADVEPDSNTPEWIEWRRAMVRKLHEMRQGAPALAGPDEAVPLLGACEVEALEERAARRLREFLALGGAVSVSGGVAVLGGKQGALQKLADRERAAGRKRSDRSDISKELRSEVLRQRASRA